MLDFVFMFSMFLCVAAACIAIFSWWSVWRLLKIIEKKIEKHGCKVRSWQEQKCLLDADRRKAKMTNGKKENL